MRREYYRRETLNSYGSFALFLLLLLATTGAQALRVEDRAASFSIAVKEEAGIVRRGEPVAVSLPFAQGVLKEPRVQLTGPEGKPLAAQYRVLARWGDGSVRWLLARFFVDAAANEKLPFSVTPGPTSAATGPAIARTAEGQVLVDTGMLRARLGGAARRTAPFCDHGGRGKLGAGPGLLPGMGKTGRVSLLFSPSGRACTILAAGNLWVWLRRPHGASQMRTRSRAAGPALVPTVAGIRSPWFGAMGWQRQDKPGEIVSLETRDSAHTRTDAAVACFNPHRSGQRQ